jgi:hypothetical protein
MRAILLAAVALSLFALPACGESEDEKVERTIADYVKAEAAGDTDVACKLRDFGPGDNCEASVRQADLLDSLRPEGTPSVKERAEILAKANYDVSIKGQKAHAVAENVGSFDLEKTDGDWKIVNTPPD